MLFVQVFAKCLDDVWPAVDSRLSKDFSFMFDDSASNHFAASICQKIYCSNSESIFPAEKANSGYEYLTAFQL